LNQSGVNRAAIVDFLGRMHISPVLTAHPTEVQRKSILDAEREIAKLLEERDAITESKYGVSVKNQALLLANEQEMYSRIVQLWQTRLLRFNQLTVENEIENALSYYELTFLHEIPRIYEELELVAPLLNTIPKQTGYQIPVAQEKVQPVTATVQLFTWPKLAIAAALIGANGACQFYVYKPKTNR